MSEATAVHASVGAIFVGLGLSNVFYGVTYLQACHYFRKYKGDPIALKIAVVIVWVLESTNVAFAVHALFYYLIQNKGNFDALTNIVWSLYVPAALNGLSASIIQFFFAWRVYIMSDKNIYLVSFIYLMSITQFALSFVSSVKGVRGPAVVSLASHVGVGTASFAVTAFTDIIISASLCYYLHRKKTGHPRTNDLVNTLIVLTINNGVFSSTIALVAFITHIIIPDTLVPFACCLVLGKAYTNSLLSSLNSREGLRHKGLAVVSRPSTGLSGFSPAFKPICFTSQMGEGSASTELKRMVETDEHPTNDPA